MTMTSPANRAPQSVLNVAMLVSFTRPTESVRLAEEVMYVMA